MKTKSSSSSGSSDAKRNGLIRFIKPTATALDRIVAYREQMKLNLKNEIQVQNQNPPPEGINDEPFESGSTSGNNTSGSSITSGFRSGAARIENNRPAPTHFFGILADKTFTAEKLKTIIGKVVYTRPKSVFLEKSPSEICHRLRGLKIPQETFDLFASDSEQMTISVYFMSEALAKDFNIQVRKKRRQRKKRKAVMSHPCENSRKRIRKTDDEMEESEIHDEEDLGGPSRKKSKQSLLASLSWSPPSNWMPFDPKLPLRTAVIKYNKTAWCKWPTNHVCIRLAHESETDPQKLLILAILNSRTCARPECKLTTAELLILMDVNVNVNINSATSESNTSISVVSFSTIVLEMTKFHRRFKNVHLLLRECLASWIMKENKNIILKEKKKEDRKTFAMEKQRKMKFFETKRNPSTGSSNSSSSSGIQIELSSSGGSTSTNMLFQFVNQNQENDIEMIDLTFNSPTIEAPTTGMSKSLNSMENRQNAQGLEQNYFSKSFSLGSSFSASNPNSNSVGDKGACASSASFNVSTSISTPQETKRDKKLFIRNKLKETVSQSCILLTLAQIFRKSGASKFLGSSANSKKFWKFVRQSVFNGGIKSELELSQLMAHINPDQCQWLNGIEDPRMKSFLLAKVLTWLFRDYVLVMLRSSFYATEVSDSRYQLAFYLRETWTSVTDKLRSNYLKEKKTVPVPISEKVTGKLRFIPKNGNKVRPILSYLPELKNKLKVASAKDLIECISSSIVSYGVPDATVIHFKWKQFVTSWKRKKCPTLYFLRTDIRDAYPSVLVEKLNGIIEAFLEKNSPEGFVRLNYWHDKGSRGKKTKYSFVRRSTDSNKPLLIRCRPWNVYKPEYGSAPFEPTKAIEALNYALASSVAIVKLGHKKFTFKNGLPQGWALSQHFCNIYFGTMDNQYLAEFMNNPGEFFIRKVDDYFFVSPDPMRVSQLYNLMKNGFPDFNCRINTEKSFHNLSVSSDSNIYSLQKNNLIPFCGWKFCLTSGHLMRDLESYAGIDVCSTLTFKMSSIFTKKQNHAQYITRRLKYLTPFRLEAMLFDPSLNCRQRILKNVFIAGLMAAFRFYAMCRVIFPNFSVFSTGISSDSTLDNGDKLCQEIFVGILSFAKKMANNIQNLEKQWQWNGREKTGFNRVYNCGGSGEVECITADFESKESHLGNIKSKRNVAKRNQIPVPGPRGNMANEANLANQFITAEEILVITYQAFIIKMSEHNKTFKDKLLPWLRRKMKLLCEKMHLWKLEEIKMAVKDGMPMEFALMKI